MKNVYFIIIFLLVGAKLIAHPGGHGEGPQLVADCKISKECTAEEIKTGATTTFSYLNGSYRLPTEWKEVSEPIWTKKMNTQKEIVWVTAFENQKITNPQEKKLYFVISQDGFLLGVARDISKFSNIQNYAWVWGLGLIIIISGLALVIIRRLERKPAA